MKKTAVSAGSRTRMGEQGLRSGNMLALVEGKMRPKCSYSPVTDNHVYFAESCVWIKTH